MIGLVTMLPPPGVAVTMLVIPPAPRAPSTMEQAAHELPWWGSEPDHRTNAAMTARPSKGRAS